MEYSAFTHPGLVRPGNEDSYCTMELGGEPPALLAAVADGMGGHEGGEVASEIAISVLESTVTTSWMGSAPGEFYLSLVSEGAAAANRRIHDESISRYGKPCMGTTLTAGIIRGYMLYIAHAGDSRAYRVSRDGISQLTEDHSLVGRMVKNGNITELEAMLHPGRNILTNALGTHDGPRIDLRSEKLLPGDIIILCTDGLTNLVAKDEICKMAQSDVSLETLAKSLVELANSRGGNDNSTVIAVRCGDGEIGVQVADGR